MVSSAANTVDAYLASLPPERRDVVSAVRKLVLKALPKGYVEGMDHGMIYYSVPVSRLPETYNGHPLGYMASMPVDDFVALYERSRLQTKAGARKAAAQTPSKKKAAARKRA